MTYLMEKGIPTHFVKELSDRETLVKKVEIIPLEVIVRNRATGSFVKRFGAPDGMEFETPVVEFSYKNDELGDPPINTSQALALKLATADEIKEIKKYALAINAAMRSFFLNIGVELVDFKLEFGRLPGGGIVLADEISPDTCRFWDVKTKEKLDKDRFRQNLGGVEDAYNEMLSRVVNKAL